MKKPRSADYGGTEKVSGTATGGGRSGQSDTKVVVIITVHSFMTNTIRRDLSTFLQLK